MLRNEINTIV